jgi:hypothetical protein
VFNFIYYNCIHLLVFDLFSTPGPGGAISSVVHIGAVDGRLDGFATCLNTFLATCIAS